MIIKDKEYTILDLSYILDLSQDFLLRILLNSNITIKFPNYYRLRVYEIETLLNSVSKINPEYSKLSCMKQQELDDQRNKLIIDKPINSSIVFKTNKPFKTQKKDSYITDETNEHTISKEFEIIESDFNIQEIVNFKKFKKDNSGNIEFTNSEILSICEGLNLSEARALIYKYKKNNEDLEIINRLKEIALLAINKYGEDQMLYYMSLPPATYKFDNVTKIFHELDLRLQKVSKPVLRLILGKDKNERATVSFYSESNPNLNSRDIFKNIIEVKDKLSSKVIFQIHRDGKLKVVNNVKNIIIKLNLFIQFCDNPNKMIINYGLSMGECSECGRELNDPISIKRGIGPNCYKNYYK